MLSPHDEMRMLKELLHTLDNGPRTPDVPAVRAAVLKRLAKLLLEQEVHS